mgnify:CR=1 FL=1
MLGYRNQPEKTASTIIDGWFYTGDLATIDEDGFVKIIGRKKELFKTANGKYVRPIAIEQKLIHQDSLIYIEADKDWTALDLPACWQYFKNTKAGSVHSYLAKVDFTYV